MVNREIKKIVIHCSDTLTGDAEIIRKYHMMPAEKGGRGYSDISYHYVIIPNGTVQVGRPENVIGAHAEGHNTDSIGICLIGKTEFTIPQLESMKKLVRGILNSNGLTYDEVVCHYEINTRGKTCPNLPGCLVRAYIKGDL